MFRLLSVLVVALLLCARPSAAEFSSYAIVHDDASLVIQNKVVRLFGVYIPDPGRFCDTQLRPAFCGNRAATALNFTIQGFVTCQEMGITYDDGSISAICWTSARRDRSGRLPDSPGSGSRRPRRALRVPGSGAHRADQRARRLGLPGGSVPASLHRSATQRDTLPLRELDAGSRYNPCSGRGMRHARTDRPPASRQRATSGRSGTQCL